ncbi:MULTISPECIES: Do family serine endopeptidase [Rhizobium/Agrobacterium group]|uniref:Do family serine endopeptidase n=1 Tax=Rhizobium/Agrobacterium group TaxID=227290 RepID=UPI00110E4A70|nr:MULTISPECIES: Do family serine endopeptidase [Rhizobium/Agrobacterium group]NWJ25237.1 Do family serine endopeptidase [Rhizobium sp. RM]TMV16989.1 Do family serine endopeptidase [Rhizobium sp. Td3]UXS00591.1 Do family serine endopeptidase [Agrobacterium tumefaciens]
MSNSQNGRPSLKNFLKATTVGGLAALMLSTGVAAPIAQSFAAPVEVNAPQVPSFANVVDAVSPAVVSVRVQSNVQPASDDSNSFSFNFGGRGLDQLPDDHPLKRFFKEFGGPNMDRGDRGDRGPNRHRDGKGPLRPVAQGSGFFISEDGYVVTNNHVVDDGSAYTVVMNDGTELDAKLVGRDPRTDLALLKVDVNRKFTYVRFADDSKVRVGDWVVAVGNPFGLGGTVTSGIISARGRDIGSGPYDDYLQIDAAVNRGNSGGPAFNLNGEVVGINTAIFSPSGGNVGIAFAIPASVAKDVIADLQKDGKVERGWLGVQIQPVSKDIAESLGLSEASGALVVSPQAGSPGDKAGIKQGDIITAVNGDPVKDARDLSRRIGGMAPNSKIEVSLWRDGKSQSVTVTLGDLASDDASKATPTQNDDNGSQPSSEKALSSLGLTVAPSDDGNGLAITDVDPDSDAAARGLKTGEKITSVNNQQVASAADVEKILEQAKKDGRSKALFQIQTENGSRFIALDIDQG